MTREFIHVAFLPGDPNNYANETIVIRFDASDENIQHELLWGIDEEYNADKFPGRYAFPYYFTYNKIKYRLWGKREEDNAILIAEPLEQKHRIPINMKRYYKNRLDSHSFEPVNITWDEEGNITEIPINDPER